MMNDHVAIYARHASELQDQASLDLQKQIDGLRSYADRQGWKVVCEFVDVGSSGVNLGRRGLRQMLDWASANPPKFTRILIESPDRLLTSATLYARRCRELELNGIDIVATTEQTWRRADPIFVMADDARDSLYGS